MGLVLGNNGWDRDTSRGNGGSSGDQQQQPLASQSGDGLRGLGPSTTTRKTSTDPPGGDGDDGDDGERGDVYMGTVNMTLSHMPLSGLSIEPMVFSTNPLVGGWVRE